MDKKSDDIDVAPLLRAVSHARIVPAEPMNVNWGGYSQIECTLRLLKLANEERHAYYHLISGSDLPLVNQDALHAFFAANIGREFVHFQQGPTSTETIERVALRRLFVEMARVDRRSKIAYVASRLERLNLRVQRRIRPAIATGNGLRLAKGSQWFSITHDLARYVLAERGWIQRTFGRSFAGDELFLQTLVALRHSAWGHRFNPPAMSSMRRR